MRNNVFLMVSTYRLRTAATEHVQSSEQADFLIPDVVKHPFLPTPPPAPSSAFFHRSSAVLVCFLLQGKNAKTNSNLGRKGFIST